MSKILPKSKLILSHQQKKYIKKAVALFSFKELANFETRYKTWNDCHSYFEKLIKKYVGKTYNDLSAQEQSESLLQLAFYLASWGMYRGSSFILQYDKSIYIEVINTVLKEKYFSLLNISFSYIKNNLQTVKTSLIEIRDELVEALKPYRNFTLYKSAFSVDVSKELSQTLITKILLGTLCCCPAYDRYFSSSIRGYFNDFFDDNKIENLLNLIDNNEIFDDLSQPLEYPLMKIVDMAYFTIGLESEFKQNYETYIVNNKMPTSLKKKKELIKQLKLFCYKLNINSV